MIRVLKYTTYRIFEDRTLPESIHISVSSVLTQDAEISGDLYLPGFIPATVVSKESVHCNYENKEEILIQYNDKYLASFNEGTQVADVPLKASDIAGLVRDTTEIRFLKAYADSLVA